MTSPFTEFDTEPPDDCIHPINPYLTVKFYSNLFEFRFKNRDEGYNSELTMTLKAVESTTQFVPKWFWKTKRENILYATFYTIGGLTPDEILEKVLNINQIAGRMRSRTGEIVCGGNGWVKVVPIGSQMQLTYQESDVLVIKVAYKIVKGNLSDLFGPCEEVIPQSQETNEEVQSA